MFPIDENYKEMRREMFLYVSKIMGFWSEDAAKRYSVSPKIVEGWKSGEIVVPKYVYRDVRKLLTEFRGVVGKIYDHLYAHRTEDISGRELSFLAKKLPERSQTVALLLATKDVRKTFERKKKYSLEKEMRFKKAASRISINNADIDFSMMKLFSMMNTAA